MADVVFEYTHPDDDIAGLVTPTLAAGTPATGYGPELLYDNDPAHPFKTESTTFRLVWNYLSVKAPKLVVLVHPNFSAGAVVKYQMHTADVWTSPDFSQTFPAASYHEDKFPKNLHLDLRVAAPSYQYASLAVTTASSVNCSIGEMIVATTVRALDGTYERNAQDDEDHPLNEHRTDVGVSTIYVHGTRLRWMRGELVQEGSDAANIRSWNRATLGRGLPCVIMSHHNPDDDEPWFVRFEKTKLPRAYIAAGGVSRLPLDFEEVSRGLKPTPSAV